MILPYFLLLVCALNAETVDKRGFIVRDQEGNFYLSPLPNVKSCCVKKIPERVQLIGDFGSHSSYSAVTLKGEFISDSEGDKLFSDEHALRNWLSQKQRAH